jgi:hypothetical protein
MLSEEKCFQKSRDFDLNQWQKDNPSYNCCNQSGVGGNMDVLIYRRVFTATALLFLTCSGALSAMECTVCHSKNPAMVKMHKATKEKGINCFDCHKIGERLMGKGQPKDRDSLLKRRVSDGVCTGCHR